MNFPAESQEEVRPWKKELIVSLFKRQEILRIIFIIFILPSIGLAFRLFYIGIDLHSLNKSSLTWPTISCRVENVTPHWYAKKNPYGFWDPGDPAVTEGDGPSRYYTRHHEILYKYAFDETTYTSNRYSIPRHYEMVIFDMYSGKDFSLDSNYVPGKSYVCYVNPKNHGQAVLSRSSLSTSDYALHMFWPFVVFVLYSLIPVGIYKKYRSNKKQLSELITGQKENILEDMNRLINSAEYDRYR